MNISPLAAAINQNKPKTDFMTPGQKAMKKVATMHKAKQTGNVGTMTQDGQLSEHVKEHLEMTVLIELWMEINGRSQKNMKKAVAAVRELEITDWQAHVLTRYKAQGAFSRHVESVELLEKLHANGFM